MPEPKVSAAAFRGFRIKIDQKKLDALYSRILQQPQKAPPIYFELEKTPYNSDTLAFYGTGKKEIHLLLPNWPSKYFKDYQSFKRHFLNIFIHECSHAIGFTKSPPSLIAKIHKQVLKIRIAVGGFIHRFIIRWLLVLLPVTFLTALLFGHYCQIFHWLFWFTVSFFCLFGIFMLGSEMLMEILATIIKNRLLKQYGAEFHEIVKITKI